MSDKYFAVAFLLSLNSTQNSDDASMEIKAENLLIELLLSEVFDNIVLLELWVEYILLGIRCRLGLKKE